MDSAILPKQARQSLKFTVGDYCLAQYSFEAMIVDDPIGAHLQKPSSLHELSEAARTCARPLVIRLFPTEDALPRLALAGPRLRYAPIQYQRYFVEFSGTFDGYAAKFSAKSRSTMKRKIKKFAQLSGGTVDYREYRAPSEMAEFHRLATELSSKTYQERIFSEGFASQAGTVEAVSRAAEQDLVRGYMIFHEGRPVAYVFGRRSSDTLLYSLLGYDPEYRQYSPGDILLWFLIERGFDRREFRYLDFGEGGGWYKEFFANRSSRCARLYFFPMRPGMLLLVGLHTATNILSDFAGRILDRFELRDRVRRFFRRRAVEGAFG